MKLDEINLLILNERLKVSELPFNVYILYTQCYGHRFDEKIQFREPGNSCSFQVFSITSENEPKSNSVRKADGSYVLWRDEPQGNIAYHVIEALRLRCIGTQNDRLSMMMARDERTGPLDYRAAATLQMFRRCCPTQNPPGELEMYLYSMKLVVSRTDPEDVNNNEVETRAYDPENQTDN